MTWLAKDIWRTETTSCRRLCVIQTSRDRLQSERDASKLPFLQALAFIMARYACKETNMTERRLATSPGSISHALKGKDDVAVLGLPWSRRVN